MIFTGTGTYLDDKNSSQNFPVTVPGIKIWATTLFVVVIIIVFRFQQVRFCLVGPSLPHLGKSAYRDVSARASDKQDTEFLIPNSTYIHLSTFHIFSIVARIVSLLFIESIEYANIVTKFLIFSQLKKTVCTTTNYFIPSTVLCKTNNVSKYHFTVTTRRPLNVA